MVDASEVTGLIVTLHKLHYGIRSAEHAKHKDKLVAEFSCALAMFNDWLLERDYPALATIVQAASRRQKLFGQSMAESTAHILPRIYSFVGAQTPCAIVDAQFYKSNHDIGVDIRLSLGEMSSNKLSQGERAIFLALSTRPWRTSYGYALNLCPEFTFKMVFSLDDAERSLDVPSFTVALQRDSVRLQKALQESLQSRYAQRLST